MWIFFLFLRTLERRLTDVLLLYPNKIHIIIIIIEIYMPLKRDFFNKRWIMYQNRNSV